MRASTFLLGASLQALHAAALPVVASDSPITATSLAATSSPTAVPYDWSAGYNSEFTIHQSCNATERREIALGLEGAVTLARHAKDHILVQGNSSKIFQKYFGQGPTAPVIGWFDKIATANKAGVIFRCDDPDKNCATQDGWNGHHRGSNATQETVICELSYFSRLPITAMCARGFTIAGGKINQYWASDLMHRLFHIPTVSEGIIDHVADGYTNILELAAGVNYTEAARNSASLQYFALEAYAYDIAVPGEGCLGKVVEEDEAHGQAAVSSTITASTTVNPIRVIPATTTAAAAPVQTGAGTDCHTHDDGTLHCV